MRGSLGKRDGKAAIANVIPAPGPDVEILDFNERARRRPCAPTATPTTLGRPFFDTNRLIAATFGAAGYPAPFVVEKRRQGPPIN